MALADQSIPVTLTPRQSEVLRLVCDGLCNKLIAHELGIGIGTVKDRVTELNDIMHVRSRTQLLRAALLSGLYALPGYTLQPIPWQETIQ